MSAPQHDPSKPRGHLPPDGTLVSAMTIGSDEHDEPSVPIRGILTTRWITAWDNWQCAVGGVLVIPESVKPLP